MAFEFKLPDIGEGVHEGEIVRWLVKEGDRVEEFQPMVEVMTDKATVEIPAPKSGVILKLMAKEGEVVKVGSILVLIGELGEVVGPPPKLEEEVAAEAGRAAPSQPQGAATTAAVTAPHPQRVLATPATRKLARELGVEINLVPGSGPGGRITDQDVRAFAASHKAGAVTRPREKPVAVPAAQLSPALQREERLPLRGIRKRIAERMHRSKTTAAHFTYVDEVDMTELVKLREEAKALAERKGIKLTYLPFIIKSLIQALKQYPYLNSSIDDARGEIVIKHYYNIGIATATDEGLIVPVVKDADKKSILELAADIERLANKAREGKIALEELQGGTFTITSLGALGGLFATPIINYPESAILGVHEIKKKPVVRDSTIVIRDMMLLSLSFDHRLIDGHVGAMFAKELIKYLEDPKLLLMAMI